MTVLAGSFQGKGVHQIDESCRELKQEPPWGPLDLPRKPSPKWLPLSNATEGRASLHQSLRGSPPALVRSCEVSALAVRNTMTSKRLFQFFGPLLPHRRVNSTHLAFVRTDEMLWVMPRHPGSPQYRTADHTTMLLSTRS